MVAVIERRESDGESDGKRERRDVVHRECNRAAHDASQVAPRELIHLATECDRPARHVADARAEAPARTATRAEGRAAVIFN